jgi:hypothetical protein
MTAYKNFKNIGVDIFDPNNAYFNDRCLGLIDNKTQSDTTLNYRRTNYYQSVTTKCSGANCVYLGINEKNYVECNCGVQSDNYFVQTQSYLLDTLSTFNIGVMKCPHVIQVYNN